MIAEKVECKGNHCESGKYYAFKIGGLVFQVSAYIYDIDEQYVEDVIGWIVHNLNEPYFHASPVRPKWKKDPYDKGE